MMTRMFDAEPTEEMTETENLGYRDEIEEEKPRERPAFRFPIITDAEIYGWESDSDPDIREAAEVRATKELITELDDEFEPVPLYKNDRWPVKNEKVTIHRATPRPKYEENIGIRSSGATTTSEKPTNEVGKETVKKRNNRPFTPTVVPSPVYGYRKPVPVQKENENTIITKHLPDKLEVEESELIEQVQRIEPEDSVHTTDKEVMTDSPVELEEHIELEETINPEKMAPAKTEKIVPFNVLMLKNDKAKYEQKQKVESQQETPSQPIYSPEQPIYESANSTEQLIPVAEEPASIEEAILIEEPALTEEVIPVVESALTEEPPTESEDHPYYAFPSKDFLVRAEEHIEDTEWLQTQSEKLEEALSYFAVQANVIEAVQGPTVTRFELTVGHGTKVSKIRNLTDDLKLALAAEDIRIQAPIPGTSSIGIEIPNRNPRAVRISEVIETKRFQESDSPLEAVLGLSLTGEPVTLDLRKMPHGMIAGATGSGKSVCINSILISLLYKSSPTDLKMLLIDPKMVELAPYNGIPHLLSPVITDVKAATAALKWAVGEMERRYELFAHIGARNIERYNEMAEQDRKFSLKLPYLLIVIDELADLMMMAPADVEVSISRITQKARACGIHLIIATQRPSVDVITGTIKANVPTRIAFSVSSQIDSRTIIDTPGAERLLGKGDMLYLGNGQSSAVRLQGTFVTDEEIERIIEHVQNEAEPDYLFGQDDLLANIVDEEETDPLFIEACRFIVEQGSASTSLLQRNFSIGYNRAAKLMDRMEKLGFISEQRGTKAREVFLTDSSFEQFMNGTDQGT